MMYKALSPHAIRVQANTLADAISAARRHGYGGTEFNIREVADLVDAHGADAVRAMFADAGIKPAGWGLPVDWRGDDATWRKGLDELPRLAAAAAAIGAHRTMTWIMPGSDDRALEENRRFHVERFTPIASILHQHHCSLGLEFIGPKTLRDGFKHPFIHTMEDMLAMGAEIGPNVGILLDCFHWHTSHGTADQLRALRPEQVVYVHVNDAAAGLPPDEQIDNIRALPGETGEIDIVAFLQALREIGYTGPVAAEPFKKELADLPDDDARLAAVSRALDDIFRRAGIA
jgi:sugar phosphate isomerase/epimerase